MHLVLIHIKNIWNHIARNFYGTICQICLGSLFQIIPYTKF